MRRALADMKACESVIRNSGASVVLCLKEFTAKASRVIVPEINYTGQLARLIRGDVGISVESRAKCDGLPFTAEDIYEMITEAAQ